jgi:tRNA threonylcarbamoyladenosine biosynthesis protein TsaB
VSADLLLAFDTSGSLGSVAVSHGADVLARGVMTVQGGHAAGLVPLVEETLDDAGVDRAELQGVLVGEGPGSFTGVRVAAATAKGLSRALGVPLWSVSSLAAEALSARGRGVRYVLFDARAERVYGACYGVGVDRVEVLIAHHAGELRDVLAGDVPPGAVFMGDAAERHRVVIEGAGFGVGPVGPASALSRGVGAEWTRADGLIRFRSLTPALQPVRDPGSWEPEYVRASRVERMWNA